MMNAIESIIFNTYKQRGGGFCPKGQPQGLPLRAVATSQCGACYHFPGDGQKCPATLDTVSRKVRACGEYA